MPKPVSRTRRSRQFTRILAGLMSLWTRPRWWTLPSAAAMPMARRKKRLRLHRRAEQPLERLAAGILEHQRGPAALADELQRPRRPCAVQFVPQSIFVGEAIEGRRRRLLRGGQHGQHGVRLPSAPRRQARQKTRSPSSHKTWKLPSPSAPTRDDAFIYRITAPSSRSPLPGRDGLCDRSSAQLVRPRLEAKSAQTLRHCHVRLRQAPELT